MDPNRPVRPPIYQTATFRFESVEQMEEIMKKGARFPKDKTGEYVYTRGSNPNVRRLENRIAELEDAYDSVVFSSGMSAIASTLFTLLKSGSKVLLGGPVYGDTHVLLTDFLGKFGIKTEVVPAHEINVDKSYDLIFLEAVTNPTLRVPPVYELEGTLVIDNTFVTPIFYEALRHAYVVVASLTKFMNGHSDALGGYAASNDEELIERLRFTLFLTGGAIDPFAARLIERGIDTLEHRLREYDKAAMRLVEELLDMGFAARYPMHPSHPDYHIAKRLLKGFTGIVAVDVMDEKKAVEIVNALAKEFYLSPSFGAPDTFVELPRRLSHAFMSDKEKRALGISPGLIRISLGFKSPLEDALRIVDIFKLFK